MSSKVQWYTSLLDNQVQFITRGIIALSILAVGVPIAGAQSDDSAALGIFVGAVSVSILLLVTLTGTVDRLQALSLSIPEEVKDNASSKSFENNPWTFFRVLVAAAIVGMNVGFGLILF